MTATVKCPHCGDAMVLRQRYTGGQGYAYYYECDECLIGIPVMDLLEVGA